MDSRPAVWYEGELGVAKKDVALHRKKNEDKRKAHSEEADESGLVQIGIRCAEDSREIFAVLEDTNHDEHF